MQRTSRSPEGPRRRSHRFQLLTSGARDRKRQASGEGATTIDQQLRKCCEFISVSLRSALASSCAPSPWTSFRCEQERMACRGSTHSPRYSENGEPLEKLRCDTDGSASRRRDVVSATCPPPRRDVPYPIEVKLLRFVLKLDLEAENGEKRRCAVG